MFMFESEFEAAAIKAYHEDPWTSDSEAEEGSNNSADSSKDKNMLKEGGEIELSDRSGRRSGSDVQYDGGSKSSKKQKNGSNQNDVGFF